MVLDVIFFFVLKGELGECLFSFTSSMIVLENAGRSYDLYLETYC